MTDNPTGRDIGVRDIVGPEFMPRIGRGFLENSLRGGGRLTFPDQQPHQAALGDRAGREAAVQFGEPSLGGRMMDVVGNEQGYQDVGVEKHGH
jgi:hypothetical protein